VSAQEGFGPGSVFGSWGGLGVGGWGGGRGEEVGGRRWGGGGCEWQWVLWWLCCMWCVDVGDNTKARHGRVCRARHYRAQLRWLPECCDLERFGKETVLNVTS
jgi:hypothetical protein